jgi:hypothetical protein
MDSILRDEVTRLSPRQKVALVRFSKKIDRYRGVIDELSRNPPEPLQGGKKSKIFQKVDALAQHDLRSSIPLHFESLRTELGCDSRLHGGSLMTSITNGTKRLGAIASDIDRDISTTARIVAGAANKATKNLDAGVERLVRPVEQLDNFLDGLQRTLKGLAQDVASAAGAAATARAKAALDNGIKEAKAAYLQLRMKMGYSPKHGPENNPLLTKRTRTQIAQQQVTDFVKDSIEFAESKGLTDEHIIEAGKKAFQKVEENLANEEDQAKEEKIKSEPLPQAKMVNDSLRAATDVAAMAKQGASFLSKPWVTSRIGSVGIRACTRVAMTVARTLPVIGWAVYACDIAINIARFATGEIDVAQLIAGISQVDWIMDMAGYENPRQKEEREAREKAEREKAEDANDLLSLQIMAARWEKAANELLHRLSDMIGPTLDFFDEWNHDDDDVAFTLDMVGEKVHRYVNIRIDYLTTFDPAWFTTRVMKDVSHVAASPCIINSGLPPYIGGSVSVGPTLITNAQYPWQYGQLSALNLILWPPVKDVKKYTTDMPSNGAWFPYLSTYIRFGEEVDALTRTPKDGKFVSEFCTAVILGNKLNVQTMYNNGSVIYKKPYYWNSRNTDGWTYEAQRLPAGMYNGNPVQFEATPNGNQINRGKFFDSDYQEIKATTAPTLVNPNNETLYGDAITRFTTAGNFSEWNVSANTYGGSSSMVNYTTSVQPYRFQGLGFDVSLDDQSRASTPNTLLDEYYVSPRTQPVVRATGGTLWLRHCLTEDDITSVVEVLENVWDRGDGSIMNFADRVDESDANSKIYDPNVDFGKGGVPAFFLYSKQAQQYLWPAMNQSRSTVVEEGEDQDGKKVRSIENTSRVFVSNLRKADADAQKAKQGTATATDPNQAPPPVDSVSENLAKLSESKLDGMVATEFSAKLSVAADQLGIYDDAKNNVSDLVDTYDLAGAAETEGINLADKFTKEGDAIRARQDAEAAAKAAAEREYNSRFSSAADRQRYEADVAARTAENEATAKGAAENAWRFDTGDPNAAAEAAAAAAQAAKDRDDAAEKADNEYVSTHPEVAEQRAAEQARLQQEADDQEAATTAAGVAAANGPTLSLTGGTRKRRRPVEVIIEHERDPIRIEQQVANHCSIHAINNALQADVVSWQDALDSIKRRFDLANKRRAESRRPLLDWRTFLDDNTSKGASLSDVAQVLRDKGIFMHEYYSVSYSSLIHGNWVVCGEYPEYGHAIAIHNGLVIESMKHRAKPYRLTPDMKWPEGFEPTVFIQLHDRPPQDTVGSEVIDLKSEDDLEGTGRPKWYTRRMGGNSQSATTTIQKLYNPRELQEMCKQSYAISKGRKPTSVGKWQLISSTPTDLLYHDFGIYVIAVRGTQGPLTGEDWSANRTIPFNGLVSTQRCQNDIATVTQWKQLHGGSEWYATGHSLGGAICDELLRIGLVKEAFTFNPAVQTKDFNGQLLNNRIYSRGDPLYQVFGQFTAGAKLMPAESLTAELSTKSSPAYFALHALQEHNLNAFNTVPDEQVGRGMSGGSTLEERGYANAIREEFRPIHHPKDFEEGIPGEVRALSNFVLHHSSNQTIDDKFPGISNVLKDAYQNPAKYGLAHMPGSIDDFSGHWSTTHPEHHPDILFPPNASPTGRTYNQHVLPAIEPPVDYIQEAKLAQEAVKARQEAEDEKKREETLLKDKERQKYLERLHETKRKFAMQMFAKAQVTPPSELLSGMGKKKRGGMALRAVEAFEHVGSFPKDTCSFIAIDCLRAYFKRLRDVVPPAVEGPEMEGVDREDYLRLRPYADWRLYEWFKTVFPGGDIEYFVNADAEFLITGDGGVSLEYKDHAEIRPVFENALADALYDAQEHHTAGLLYMAFGRPTKRARMARKLKNRDRKLESDLFNDLMNDEPALEDDSWAVADARLKSSGYIPEGTQEVIEKVSQHLAGTGHGGAKTKRTRNEDEDLDDIEYYYHVVFFVGDPVTGKLSLFEPGPDADLQSLLAADKHMEISPDDPKGTWKKLNDALSRPGYSLDFTAFIHINYPPIDDVVDDKEYEIPRRSDYRSRAIRQHIRENERVDEVDENPELHGSGFFDDLKNVAGKITNEITNPESVLRQAPDKLTNEFTNSESVLNKAVESGVTSGLDTISNGLDYWIARQYKASTASFMAKHGGEPLYNLKIRRYPVPEYIDQVFNLISANKWEKEKKNASYDDFFHLGIIMDDRYVLEKNASLNFFEGVDHFRGEMFMPVTKKIPKDLTIGIAMEKTRAAIGNEAFFRYDPFSNNCQSFVMAFLRYNNLMDFDLYEFIDQPVGEILQKVPSYVPAFGRTLTNLGALFGNGKRRVIK